MNPQTEQQTTQTNTEDKDSLTEEELKKKKYFLGYFFCPLY